MDPKNDGYITSTFIAATFTASSGSCVVEWTPVRDDDNDYTSGESVPYQVDADSKNLIGISLATTGRTNIYLKAT